MSTNEKDITFNHKSDFSNPNAQRIRGKRKLLGSGQKVNNFELRFAGRKGKASLYSSPDITYMGINIDDPEDTNKYFHFHLWQQYNQMAAGPMHFSIGPKFCL